MTEDEILNTIQKLKEETGEEYIHLYGSRFASKKFFDQAMETARKELMKESKQEMIDNEYDYDDPYNNWLERDDEALQFMRDAEEEAATRDYIEYLENKISILTNGISAINRQIKTYHESNNPHKISFSCRLGGIDADEFKAAIDLIEINKN